MGQAWKHSVLVVEDEPLLRMDAVDLFGELGWTVYEAANADAALDLLQRQNDIDALFTDIEMPGSINGLQLVDVVRLRYPHMQIIVTSGRMRLSDLSLPDAVQFLPKPYHSYQIERVLEA